MNTWLTTILFSLVILILGTQLSAFAQPFMAEPNFLIEEYVSGLKFPTKMAFIENDIIVLEKFTGNVRLVKDGQLLEEPLLQLKVDQNVETGLLGITTVNSTVYLYFTEVKTDEPIVPGKLLPREQVLGNRIYKYSWDGENLLESDLVKDLPFDSSERAVHSGGAMVTGLDGTVYAVIGDSIRRGILQNLETGSFDDTSVILKVNYDESVLKPSQTENPLAHYFALGIRNSYGLAIDPLTGFLWDTENGALDFDEINLVESKFNSGWVKIMGPSTEEQIKNLPTSHGFIYSDPEFSWEQTVAPTGLVFVNSELFNDYNDSLLVGDWNTGSIYRFKLNSERTGFVFDDPGLKDLVLNTEDTYHEIVFASGLGGITDLHFGPDGLLYVLSIGKGTIYRIVPTAESKEISKIFIPKWVKNNAGWWAENLIGDSDFVLGIQYLITKGVMTIPLTDTETTQSQEIPDWIRNNAGWWANGSISDIDFVSGLQQLIANGVIKISDNRCDSSLRKGVNLSSCQLFGKDLSNSELILAKFKRANLKNANFSKSDLRLADFEKANLIDTDFSKSNLLMANFKDADLTNSKLDEARLMFVNMEGATLEGAHLKSAQMVKINLMDANLNYANVTKGNLRYSNLENTTITGADLSDINLSSANLENVNLSNTNLTNGNLQSSKLVNTIIRNADLSYSFLKWTKFENVDLTGTDLKYAEIFRATLTNVNFTGANLIYADLREAKINGANFTGANLTNANFTGSRMTNVDFTGCIGHPSCSLN